MASEQVLQNIFRIGEVVGVNPAAGTVRVEFKDADAVVSFDLPLMFTTTLNDMRYRMPDLKAQAICLFLPNGLEEGAVLGFLYNATDKPPANSQDLDLIKYEDGTVLQYDRAAHKLTADVKGEAEIKATGKISATSEADISAKASGNIKTEAQGNNDIEAAGSVTIKASGAVTITGGGGVSLG